MDNSDTYVGGYSALFNKAQDIKVLMETAKLHNIRTNEEFLLKLIDKIYLTK